MSILNENERNKIFENKMLTNYSDSHYILTDGSNSGKDVGGAIYELKKKT